LSCKVTFHGETASAAGTRVVHEDVDGRTPESVFDLADSVGRRKVGGDGAGLDPVLANELAGDGRESIGASGDEQHVVSVARREPCELVADAARCACDERERPGRGVSSCHARLPTARAPEAPGAVHLAAALRRHDPA
jgi:hypothetical protein